jgi:hypothetical protein
MQRGEALFVSVSCFAVMVIAQMYLLPGLLEAPDHSDAGEDRLAAYIQTSGLHLQALDEALHRFRKFYPTAPLYVHNDGGGRAVRQLALLYRARDYTEASTAQSARPNGLYFRDPAGGTAYLERIAAAARLAPWLLILEDDVWLYGRIRTSELSYDINSKCDAHFAVPLGALVSKSKGGMCYAPCGGSVLRSSRLLSANRTLAGVSEIMKHTTASDQLLSATVLMGGGGIGAYGGYSETWWRFGVVILHHAKYAY